MPGQAPNKDRLYAQHLAAGMSQLEAYHAAGFKGGKVGASRKANNPQIKAVVEQLQRAQFNRQIIDKKWVLDELVDTYKCAKADEDWQAARGCLKDIGLEFQMFIERKDIRVHAMFEKVSDADLIQMIEQAKPEALSIANNSDDEE
jgi:hypothetical protein